MFEPIAGTTWQVPYVAVKSNGTHVTTGTDVKCAIYDATQGMWWDGDSWEAAATDLSMTHRRKGGWVYAFACPEAVSGHVIELYRYDDVDATISAQDVVTAISAKLSTYEGGPVASVTAAVTAGTVTDKAGYSLATAPPTAADIATAVWGATTRTLSGFGTLVADVAAGVWAAATRTLTDKTGFRLSSTGVAEVAAAAKTGSAAAQVVVGGTPAQYPTGEVVVVRGDETEISLEFVDQDGAAIDLTSYTTGAGELTLTVKPMSARNDADDTNALLQIAGASVSPTTGIATFTLSADDSELATVGEVYDLDVQGDAGSGHVQTLMVGTFRVTMDVTRVSSATAAPAP